jgi:ribonuclease HI
VEEWARENKIVFNSQKSQIMHVARKRRSGDPLRVFLWGERLKQVQVLKYLGVWFDEHLSWAHHITTICGKASQLVHALSRSAKVYWGVGTEALGTIYRGAVLPVLSYAVPVWGEALRRAYNVRKVRAVQRKMALRAIKGYRTISHEAASLIAGFMPVEIYLGAEIQKHNTIHGVSPTFPALEVDVNIPPDEWVHPACVGLPGMDIVADENTFLLYTDGSKTEDCTSCAFVVFRGSLTESIFSRKLRLAGWCTNNQAEMLAIRAAVEWLTSVDVPMTQRRAVISTDNQTCLFMLQNAKVRIKSVEVIRHLLTALRSAHWEVSFQWVRAHSGEMGNELADRLAKEASHDDTLPTEFAMMSIGSIKHINRCSALEKWEEQWAATTNGSHTRKFFRLVADRLKTPLRITFKMTQALTDHGKHLAYLHRFNLRQSPDCDCVVGGPQDWDHLLMECGKFEPARSRLIRKIVLTGGNWPPSHADLTSKYLADFEIFVNSLDWENF